MYIQLVSIGTFVYIVSRGQLNLLGKLMKFNAFIRTIILILFKYNRHNVVYECLIQFSFSHFSSTLS